MEQKRKDHKAHAAEESAASNQILSGEEVENSIIITHKETGKMLCRVKSNAGTDVDFPNLVYADLAGADLAGANLQGANLKLANLQQADLTGANLIGADLSTSFLSFANLSGANLTSANLSGAQMTGINFTGAIIGFTILTNNSFLASAQGLDTIEHVGPSHLDVLTLRTCVNDLPYIFLQGVGYTNEEIEQLHAMYRKGIAYYSCFLSYAHLNSEFADRLRRDLLDNGVSCWQDSQDLRSGQKWEGQINTAIKAHDKLVLLCSRQSIYRPQVVREILQAIWTERESGEQKLFPIRLDDQILSDEMLEDAREKVRSGEWSENWVHEVRKYQIADFTRWKDHDAYQKALGNLLRDLKKASRPHESEQ